MGATTQPKPTPVVQVRCPVCQGAGWRETHVDELGGHGYRCVWCAGQGWYWTEEVGDAA